MSSRGGIAAACGCVGACVALFHFGRLARAARADVASVEDSIVSAEADLIAAGASTRDFGEPKQTRVSGSARRVTREARRRLRKLRSRYFAVPPPSLGMLGVGKLAAVARTGGTLFLVGSIVDQVVHRGLSVSRGTVRAQAGAVGAALVAKVLARTGATSLAMVAAITTLVGVRTVQKRRAGHDLSFAAALESLGRDLHSWAESMGSTDLKTHSEGHQGWLVSQHAETPVIDVTPSFHSKLARLKKARAGTHKGTLTRSAVIEALGAPRIASDRAQGWDAVCVLLVPGLWTKWYPFYFGALTETLKKLAIDFRVSKVDSDSTVERNAAVLSAELADLTLTRHVIIYAHSKGAIDVEQAIYAAPRSVRSNIAAFVSAQGPHGGSIVGNDVLGTQLQQGVVGFITERILGGSGRRAVTDLGYASRRAYYASRPETWWLKAAMPDARDWVPTVCLCGSATHQPRSLLSPIVEYYRYRYECAVDGLCAREDTALPGAPAVFVSDMDHFGPAWSGFPSTDRYDSVHIFFVMVAMALEHRAGVLVPRHTRARPASAQGGLSPDDADGDASYTDDCASTVHLSDGEASEADVLRLDGSAPPGGAEGEARLEAERSCKHAISRVASWGWFDAETMALDADAMSPKSPHSPHSPAKARPC